MADFDPMRDLPSDADNYDVFCERCKRVHPYYAMTREGYQRMISEQVKKLADEIDRRAMAAFYESGERRARHAESASAESVEPVAVAPPPAPPKVL